MMRRICVDVAKLSTSRALQQYAASCSGRDAATIGCLCAAQTSYVASLAFSTDLKNNLLNAQPKSLASIRPNDKPNPGMEQNWFTRAMLRVGGFYSRESQRLRGANSLYQGATEQVADSRMYEALGLEHNFASKYAMLSIHIWLLLVRLRAEEKEGKQLAQALYENFTEDVELRVRAEGVKVRLSKHLKDLEQMFYGSSLAYDQALDGKESLADAVLRNVYGNKPERRKSAEVLARYMKRELACLAMTATEDVMAGNISFSNDFLGSDSS